MSVAPFLPRTGVAYIPRPQLIISAVAAGVGSVDVTVAGITPGLGAGDVHLRISNSDGERVHDLVEARAIGDPQVVFAGVRVQDTNPHRLEALTDLGQRGLVVIDSVPATIITITGVSALDASALTAVAITGTNFQSNLFFEVADSDGENIVIADASNATADFDLTDITPGPAMMRAYLPPYSVDDMVAEFEVTIGPPALVA
jgi:hypothetical protein